MSDVVGPISYATDEELPSREAASTRGRPQARREGEKG